MLGNLTVKELIVFSMAYHNKLDENGELKDTKMNRLRYKACCKIAGGKEKLDDMCVSIFEKMKALGFNVDTES